MALNDCQQLESFVQHRLAEEHSIQQELYKSYADLYFNRGLVIIWAVDNQIERCDHHINQVKNSADEQRSKCYDFPRAKHYYELERETLRNLEGRSND